jgi:hypothetical protein
MTFGMTYVFVILFLTEGVTAQEWSLGSFMVTLVGQGHCLVIEDGVA